MVKAVVDDVVNGVGVQQVYYADRVCDLTKAVDSAYPLLHAHWIPRQIVIDHGAAELEVDALNTDLGGYQDADRGVFSETLELGVAVRGVAVDCRADDTVVDEPSRMIANCSPEGGKDERLFVMP